MPSIKEIVVPDIGTTEQVDVIEINIAVGDAVAVDDALITLESDKASMEVPSSDAGIVESIAVAVGDKVSEGSVILTLEIDVAAAEPTAKQPTAEKVAAATHEQTTVSTPEPVPPSTTPTLHEVHVPDIGTANKVDIIEISVGPGDIIAVDDALITLESDKASMEVPSPYAGEIKELKVAVGDKIGEADLILTMMAASEISSTPVSAAASVSKPESISASTAASTPVAVAAAPTTSGKVHAGPSVRRFAREFAVDLTKVNATGPKGRILRTDVQKFIKSVMSGAATAGTSGIPEMPAVDFSKFGEVEIQSLNKIKKLTAKNLHRAWLHVPHVTQFDEADITELEEFRQAQKQIAAERGIKLTPVAFVMKAVAAALRHFPTFNASLDPGGENLIIKKYIHLGIAVDTPDGLVVPVVRDVDQKSIFEIAKDLMTIGDKARNKRLMPTDMQGGCFTISSLGGIGGTAFTPIVNAPEVAILGLSKSKIKPVYQESEFVPRLMLPLSLSYDHRVIDGAEAARFITFLSASLTDLKELLL